MTDQTPNAAPLALAPLIPFINGDAFIGAFCGAILYVASSPESSIFKRIIYMLVSFFAGYSFGPAITHHFHVTHDGIPAFVVSAFLIVVFHMIVDKIKTGEIVTMIRGKK